MTAGERFRWRHALVCGLLWGLVVLMAVTLSQPVGDLRPIDAGIFFGALTLVWFPTGIVWAIGAKLIEQMRWPWFTFPAVLLCASGISIAMSFGATNMRPGNFGHLSYGTPVADLAIYDLWVSLFYGGLYTLGYFATRRTLRLRRRLAELRLVRDEADARLREIRLQAVRGQMQPAMLLDALDALRRAYIRDRAAGDRVFDLLIAFLRAAMPGLRSGASTLAAELAVIDRYAALREALETGPPEWRLTLAEPPADLPFPPLRLLPALDRMSRATPGQAAVEVCAQSAGDGFVVRVGAASPQPLPPTLMDRLRAQMRQDLGLGTMLSADPTGALVAELRVRRPQAAPA